MDVEKYFFNTFGYIQIPVPQLPIPFNKHQLKSEFDKEYSKHYKLPRVINSDFSIVGKEGRYTGLKCSNFTSDIIFQNFYNDGVLDFLLKLTDDFFILSSIESFHLLRSEVHRDFGGELKCIKLLMYLDDVHHPDLGSLWVIPGTHNIYDKYSASVAMNVSWPPPKGNAGFCEHSDYMYQNIPKKYLLSNCDNIIFFNTNIVHGAEGNKINPNQLRRAIGMTVLCVDRNNKAIMERVEKTYNTFSVDIDPSVLQYIKAKSPRWLNHIYYRNPNILNDFKHSEDGSDSNAILQSVKTNRMKCYLDFYDSKKEEIYTNSLYNCYYDQVQDNHI